MRRLSIPEIISNIGKGETFEAVSDTYALHIKIEAYVPYVCAAVHDGHQFRKSLWENCLHTEYERWYEEDPCTLEMVRSHPITISGLDSRFEYDLNRSPEKAIYEDAWGKQLWKSPLPKSERDLSLQKHHDFYKVVTALIGKIEELFGRALVFDMHSYNWKRWERDVPVWNLGTANIDGKRFGQLTERWNGLLGQMQLPNAIKNTSGINDTFQGNGHFLKFITQNFGNTLVLATEISKIYCDEETGILFPEVVRSVREQLKESIPLQVKEFMELPL